jgi:arabinogalactan endo-1,4-beta-galactosidase
MFMKIWHLLLLTGIIFYLNSSLLFSQEEFIRGADVSFLQQIEDNGGIFRENGAVKDPLQILKDHNINYMRLRLWNNPPAGYNNLAKLLIMAKRIKQLNLKLLLDFHYSDSWADPGKQSKPAAWVTLDSISLGDSLYNFTKDVLTALKNQNTFPDMIQVGNEITNGFLWNTGRVGPSFDTPVQWNNFASLLKRCINAANEVKGSDQLQIMIHIDRSTDSTACKWFFDNLNLYNVQFDCIGLSYYPWWDGMLEQVTANLNYLADRYNKELIITETAYPWTLAWDDTTNNIVGLQSQLLPGYPATVDGQKSFITNLISIVRNTHLNLGKGIFYWEPLDISTPTFGSGWENLTFFDFNGNLLSSISAFEDLDQVKEETNKIEGFTLSQNYPNPFNPSTIIKFEFKASTFASLKVFDIMGNEIAFLFKGAAQASKMYEVEFNGAHLSSGIYYYKLEGNGRTEIKKMILLK